MNDRQLPIPGLESEVADTAGEMDPTVARYLAHQRVRGFSERTVDRRQWSLRLWADHLDGRRLDEAATDDVETFLARYATQATRYSLHSDLRQFYRYARRRLLYDCPDPTEPVDAPKIPKRLPTPIPPAEVVRLLDAVTNPVDRVLVLLAAHAGLRVSEIANLRGEDIDIERRELTVRDGKGGKDAVVPISRTLAAALADRPRHGPVVPQPTGGAVGERIRRQFRRHGIVGRPHDLRHSFATEAMERSNGNVVLVSKLMRHATVQTTMRYVKVDRTGVDLVDQLYGEASR